jgi:Ca-activated chloride channel family protein
MSLALDARVDRPLVAPGVADTRYCLLTVRAIDGGVPRVPLNLALAIDTSGSMHGGKLGRARDAAGLVVRHLTAIDRVAIVTYDDDARVVAPSTPLTPAGKTEILYQLGRIEAGGWTNLERGWATATEEVARSEVLSADGFAAEARRVLLLSDGLANVGITSSDVLVEQARARGASGIATSTMGVGADFNGELLEAMARQGGGRFQYVESAPQIPDCVQGELGELLRLVARGVAVELSLPDGVQVRECLNDFPMESTKRGARVRLGDLAAGDARQVLLELQVDAGAVADSPVALAALAVFTDVQTGRGSELAFPVALLQPADATAVDGQVADPEVERELSLAQAARARQEAVRLSVLGDHRAAHGVLAAACETLLASAYAAHPAIATQIQALASHAVLAGRGLSRAQQQELGYQAYLLRESRRRYDRVF